MRTGRLARLGVAAAAAAATAAVLAPSASADYHLMKIKEITGDTAGGNASYIELQMYAPGQTNLAGHKLTFWDDDGLILGNPAPIGEIVLAGPSPPNGQDQRSILIGDSGVANRDYTAELSPFLEAGAGTLQINGAVCFEAIPIDCVSWGAGFTGANNLPDKTTPVATSLSTGLLAFERTITGGTCGTALDPGDDTNNAQSDFQQVASSPRPNSVVPTETPCVPAPAKAKPKKCKKKKKKGKGKAGAAAKKKKKKMQEEKEEVTNRGTNFMRIRSIVAATVVCALAAPAAASADTVVMGSTLANPYSGGVSGGSSTVSVQLSFVPGTSTNPVKSPANGIITGWKVKSADDGAIYTLKVLRPTSTVSLVTTTNTNFMGISSLPAPSAVPVGTNAATPTGVVFDYPAALPISQGDYVGLLTGGADDDLPQSNTSGLTQNLIANNFGAQPTDGTAANLLADEQHDLLLQTTVKFCRVPNLKGKKSKAAKKALIKADCAVKISKQRTGKERSFGKVIKQKKKAGFTAPPGTKIPITVGKQ